MAHQRSYKARNPFRDRKPVGEENRNARGRRYLPVARRMLEKVACLQWHTAPWRGFVNEKLGEQGRKERKAGTLILKMSIIFQTSLYRLK